jgi:hypothetical protein
MHVLTHEHFGSQCWVTEDGWIAVCDHVIASGLDADLVRGADGEICGVRTPEPLSEALWMECVRLLCQPGLSELTYR